MKKEPNKTKLGLNLKKQETITSNLFPLRVIKIVHDKHLNTILFFAFCIFVLFIF